MSYYHTCPTCGANLDPGEECLECRENKEETHHAYGFEENKHPEFQGV